MKDSTKEYLKAGGLFAWAMVKTIAVKAVNPSASTYNYGNAQTGRSVQSHWDKAGALREEEKAAAEVHVSARFLLPSGHFQDKSGKALEGGIWEVKSINGRKILLERWGCNSSHWFLWSDIKEYRLE